MRGKAKRPFEKIPLWRKREILYVNCWITKSEKNSFKRKNIEKLFYGWQQEMHFAERFGL